MVDRVCGTHGREMCLRFWLYNLKRQLGNLVLCGRIMLKLILNRQHGRESVYTRFTCQSVGTSSTVVNMIMTVGVLYNQLYIHDWLRTYWLLKNDYIRCTAVGYPASLIYLYQTACVTQVLCALVSTVRYCT